MVLGKLLKRCPTQPADWKEIDQLVEQGARVRSNSVEMLQVMNAKKKLEVHRVDHKTISMLASANCLGAKEAAAWLAREGAVSQGEALCQKR